MITEYERNHKYLLVFARHKQRPLGLNDRTQQPQFEFFLQTTGTRAGAARKEERIDAPLNRQLAHRLERLEINRIFFAAVDAIGAESVHKIGRVARIVQIETGAIAKRG